LIKHILNNIDEVIPYML